MSANQLCLCCFEGLSALRFFGKFTGSLFIMCRIKQERSIVFRECFVIMNMAIELIVDVDFLFFSFLTSEDLWLSSNLEIALFGLQ